jgi:phosphoribosylformylglycinamidine cyclo-ligase
MPREYAQAGADYTKIEPFKRAMQEVGKRTFNFPNRRGVYINAEADDVFEYRGLHKPLWDMIQEGLGNKNWIAEWMYQHAGTGRTYYEGIGIDTALMAVVDVLRRGALPVAYADEVAAGDSDWFKDESRAQTLAQSFYQACEMCGMALLGGESPALRYLIKAELPVKSAPSLSGSVIAIVAPPGRLITGHKLQVRDHIVGVTSSGLHANGISLVIKRALTLKDQFLHVLPNGRTLGEEALIPTRSYVVLVEALLGAEIDIHALLPGTGDGVGKVAFDKRPFTYRIRRWVEVPPLFQFMRELGVTLEDCLKTFNWGIGFYIFVPEEEVEQVLQIGQKAGYQLCDLGEVEEGERCVVFEPERITLPPPGE